MANLSNGEWIVRQVEMIATLSGKESARVWKSLYDDFEYRTGKAFQRTAYNSDPPKKTLTVIREEGFLDEFSKFVEDKLTALSEKPQGGVKE